MWTGVNVLYLPCAPNRTEIEGRQVPAILAPVHALRPDYAIGLHVWRPRNYEMLLDCITHK